MDLISRTFVDVVVSLAPPELQAEMRRGFDDLAMPIVRLTAEVLSAEHDGVRFAIAADDFATYPTIARVHHGLLDFLQFELPPDAVAAMRTMLARVGSAPLDDVRRTLVRAASSEPTSGTAALARFLVYEAVRLNLYLLSWVRDPEAAAHGAMHVHDEHAEIIMRERLADPAVHGGDVRPLAALVGESWTHLCALGELKQEMIASEIADVRAYYDRLVQAERIARQLGAADAALLRQEIEESRAALEGQPRPAIGSQGLADRHPLAFRTANTVDQRRRRLEERLKRERELARAGRVRMVDLLLKAAGKEA